VTAAALALASLRVPAALAQSQPDDELGRIPSESAPASPPPGSAKVHHRAFLESATELELLRSALDVPIAAPSPPALEQRLFLDSRVEWTPLSGFSLTYSGRPELRAADHIPFPTHENIRFDARELFASWRPLEGIFLDAGRINFKILASAFSAASGVSSNCARTIAPSTAKAMACISSLRRVDAGNRLAMTVVISSL